jgi:glycosyltransferase involved in cell wall biosynthesis
MKITLCAYDAPGNIDGPTTWIKRLLPYLRKNGVETRLLFLADQARNLSTLRYFQELQFACTLIPADLFFEEQLQLILKDVKKHPPDVFIPNYFPVAAYASYWIKKAGIPSVIVLHNDDDYHDCLADEFVAGKEEFQVSAVVPVSRLLAGKLAARQTGGVAVECIPYGAPIPEKAACYSKGDKLKLVYSGRLNNHQKKVSDVARALCRATKEIPDTEAVVYGSGPALQEMLAIIRQEGKGGSVTYGGSLPSDVVQQHLLGYHVYVLLSEYEGIPIALMEAMACGLVPVCSRIESGIPELIEHGKNGLIVNDRDDDFVAAIRYLKSNPSKWPVLSGEARNTISNGYSEGTTHERWLKLLKELAIKNSYAGTLAVPAIHEIKKIRVKTEFLSTEVLMPVTALLPLYRLKKMMGRLKRNYWE